MVIHPLEHETFKNNISVNINNNGEGFCSHFMENKIYASLLFWRIFMGVVFGKHTRTK